jgi:hypothetical protein
MALEQRVVLNGKPREQKIVRNREGIKTKGAGNP